jgi:hypothetical protein
MICLVPATTIHHHDHLAVVHDAIAAIAAGMIGDATTAIA